MAGMRKLHGLVRLVRCGKCAKPSEERESRFGLQTSRESNKYQQTRPAADQATAQRRARSEKSYECWNQLESFDR